jgi:hypothetical protein
MIPKVYAAVDSRLWPAAAHSMHAQIIALVKSGQVASDGAPTLDADYRLAR